MTAPYLPVPIFRAFTSGGLPLAGGLLYTYAAGSSTPQAVYGADGVSVLPNPVVLDTTGSATVRLQPNLGYKFVLKDSGGGTQWTEDNYLPYGADAPVFSGTVTAAAFTTTGAVSAATLVTTGNATIGGSLTVSGGLPTTAVLANVQNATYQFVLADISRVTEKTDANPYTYTIPLHATAAIPVGSTLFVTNTGISGSVTIAVAGGATLAGYNGYGGPYTAPPGVPIRLFQYASDAWLVLDQTQLLYNFGSFTATLTGVNATVTGSVAYVITGSQVTLKLLSAAISGTSNTTGFGFTGLPATLQPTAQRIATCIIQDNGTATGGFASMTNSGTVTFGLGFTNNTAGFTNSGAKAIPVGWCVSYAL